LAAKLIEGWHRRPPSVVAQRRAAAAAVAERLRPVLGELSGLSTRRIATELNARAIAAASGGPRS
jgi:hypothetical protein